MTSSVSAGVMNHTAASEEGGYVQLDTAAAAQDKPSRLLIGASITALTLLLTTIIALPTYLLLRSTTPSTSSLALSPAAQSVHSAVANASQYGNYPMLYEDPRNQWTPAAGFLFNMSSVDIDLNKVSLSVYQGNITLVTNVASF